MRLHALAVSAALVAIVQQDPTPYFRSESHAVSLDVAVSDGRSVVSNLDRDSFEVVDNGLPQKISTVDFNRLPIDLRLVFDTSGSISPDALARYRRAMRHVADTLQPNDHCEIVAFTTRVTDAAARQSPPVAIDLHRMMPDGTSFFDAVSLSLVTVPTLDRRHIVIVLSDAVDNSSFFDEAALMEMAKRTDAVVYTVLPLSGGTDLTPYAARLESLSLLTGGRLVQAADDEQIGSVLVAALNEYRHSYVLRYTLDNVERGWHNVKVKVKGPHGYSVRVRPGYFI
jgi:hypothetical protein